MTWLVDADVQEPVIVSQVEAFGGEVSVITVGGQTYRVHKYTGIPVGMIVEDGFGVTTGGEVQVLVVAGGGAGGSVPSSGDLGADNAYAISGGGGAGGVIECTLLVNDSSNYLVRVGAGGTFDNGGNGNGADSYIALGGNDLVRAKGGGRGGNVTLTASGNAVVDGDDGGSSGGGAFVYNSSIYADQQSNAGNRVFGQGNKGADASQTISGGGGGASEQARKIIDDTTPPDGGNGVAKTIDGSFQYYAGGGGGAGGFFGGNGGLGGGGSSTPISQPVDGLGGGGYPGFAVQIPTIGYSSIDGSDGGSGIVIIRYPIEG